MKQEFDKEMDSLLRRSVRLAAAGPRGAEGARAALAASHLDADELSAFAENALPAAARLSAATHLADCDECRGMVVRLAGAAGVGEESEKRAAAPIVPVEVPWWKSLFGSFFAPRVLRYAAPVLVLGLVGVVSLIALRPWRGGAPATVYRNEEARDAKTASAPAANVPTETTGTSAITNSNAPVASNAPPGAAPGGLVSGTAGKPDAQPSVNQPAAPPSSDLADKDSAAAVRPAPVEAGRKAGPAAEDEAKKEAADALASNTVAVPAPAPPSVAKSAGAETAEQPKGARGAEPTRNKEPEENLSYVYREQQQAEQNRAAQSRSRQGEVVQMPDGGAQRNDSRAMNNRGNVGGAYSTTPSTRAERAPAKRARRNEDSKTRDATGEDDASLRDDATRSVAGRRFRREGNAWVDTSYKTSMSMTGVRRGTEGFRALVADIPELGRIAEQLGGEVIAVVKGRAYRIR